MSQPTPIISTFTKNKTSKLSQTELKNLQHSLTLKIFNYYQAIENLKISDLWKRSWQQYYSGFYNLGVARKIKKTGEQTELLKLSINDYGNIIRNLHTLITREPPLIDAKPINPSTNAITEIIPAKILLEFYQDQKYLDKEVAQAKLYELLFGTGYLVVDWDTHAGLLNSHTLPKNPSFQGDLTFSAHSPFNVIQNIYGSPQDISWYIVRSIHNRQELAQRYQNSNLLSETMLSHQYMDIALESHTNRITEHDPEKIDVFTYYQKPSPTHPKGLKIIFSKNHILYHGILPAKQLPVIRIANETIMNTTIGSTIAFDLLEIQKSKDSLISTIINNQASFGLNSIVVPKAAQIEAHKLGTRLNILEVNDMSERPQVLDLLRSNPEMFQMISYLEKSMERISGINAVVRGNARASQSGQALALITSMSIQFASGYLRTFRESYKQAGELILSLLKENLPVSRQYRIVGRSGKIFQGNLSAQTLYDDYHISVELISPLKSTVQGREIIANTLLEKGFITEPREYLSVLAHGRIDDILSQEAKLKESLKHETENLINNEPIEILEIQNHPAFIRQNLTILNDHEKLKDPQLVSRVYHTVLKRLEVWKRASLENPELLEIAGIPIYTAIYPAPETPEAPPSPANSPTHLASSLQNPYPFSETPPPDPSLENEKELKRLQQLQELSELELSELQKLDPLNPNPSPTQFTSNQDSQPINDSETLKKIIEFIQNLRSQSSEVTPPPTSKPNTNPPKSKNSKRKNKKIPTHSKNTHSQNNVPLPKDPLTQETPQI